MKSLLSVLSLSLLISVSASAAFAGECRTIANPKSQWAKTNGGNIFLPWVDRETTLESVTVEDCLAHAIADLEIPFQGRFEINSVKYKFVGNGIKVTGKVTRD